MSKEKSELDNISIPGSDWVMKFDEGGTRIVDKDDNLLIKVSALLNATDGAALHRLITDVTNEALTTGRNQQKQKTMQILQLMG